MHIAFLLFLLIILFIAIILGGALLRHLLPTDHSLQRYLTDKAINSSLAWVMQNIHKIAGGLVILAFTIITLPYS